ncbi:SIMPL domain-containing protein [Gimibacter soli]|uniref:SIMPL domain-containing protein n=1 Tax=Gimibacter soli TaxID=3024400 RepID=A0AAE9XSJ7_9PROT|nr:SIMPL domain-containing protein [Gimibacter soli]WCL55459.1 SIMPL domain-containing protein [Gimibacter soli]
MISNKSNTSVGMVTASRISLSGWIVATNQHEKPEDRFVTVQGLAEREIMADSAVWTLRLQAHGEKEIDALAALSRQCRAVDSFLISHGLRPRDWSSGAPSLTRKEGAPVRAACTIRIETGAVWSVASAYQDTARLKANGVTLVSRPAPVFQISDISSLAPELLWEASSRARESAERYAAEAFTRLIGLKRAHQGNIEILAGEGGKGSAESGQIIKKLRVVSTLEFRLAT